MSWQVRVVRNRYVDSVRLMKVAQAVRASDGVARVRGRRWARPANLEALAALGVTADAGPTDVVIAVEPPAAARTARWTRPSASSRAAGGAGGDARRRASRRARSSPPRGGSTAPTSR